MEQVVFRTAASALLAAIAAASLNIIGFSFGIIGAVSSTVLILGVFNVLPNINRIAVVTLLAWGTIHYFTGLFDAELIYSAIDWVASQDGPIQGESK